MIIIDLLVDLVFDVAKNGAISKKETIEIRKNIHEFIEGQREYNEICTLAEEIDFQGFSEYISQMHMDELNLCVMGKKQERIAARESVLAGAINCSQAKTPQAKKVVQKLTSSIIEIIKRFYTKKIGKDLLLTHSDIVDDIDEIVQEAEKRQTQFITDAINQSTQGIIDSVKDISIMPSNPRQLLKQGNMAPIEDGYDTFVEIISKEHDLYPSYGFDFGYDHKLTSVPRSKDALEKYPPNIKFNGIAQVGDIVTSRPSPSVFDYANRHQLSIKISVQDAKKYLGDFEDPVQREAELLVGTDIIVPPKPFPEAFPCSITLDETVIFNYVLFRTEEILDDGTVIVTNSEQKHFPFRLSFRLNFSTKATDFSIHLEISDNCHRLQFARFKRETLNGTIMSVKSLETGAVFLEGKLKKDAYCGDFESIDEEIDFWEKIVAIEDYFKEPITIPPAITERDDWSIRYIYTLINGDCFERKWSVLEGQLRVTQELKDVLMETEHQSFCFLYHHSAEVTLFGKKYNLETERTYNPIKIKDYDGLNKKLSVLEIGDPIRVEFIPDEESGVGTYTDKLFTGQIEHTP